MTRVTEAVYSNGVLTPTEKLGLREQERVRLTIESIEPSSVNGDRAAAVEQFRAGASRSRFRSEGAYPSRDELHERG